MSELFCCKVLMRSAIYKLIFSSWTFCSFSKSFFFMSWESWFCSAFEATSSWVQSESLSVLEKRLEVGLTIKFGAGICKFKSWLPLSSLFAAFSASTLPTLFLSSASSSSTLDYSCICWLSVLTLTKSGFWKPEVWPLGDFWVNSNSSLFLEYY